MMMCGISSDKGNLAEKFIRKSVPFMSKNDNDGLGYIAYGDQGMFGERWLNVENAFRNRKVYSKEQNVINDFFKDAVKGNFRNYSNFGEGKLSKASSILLHTRYATCHKNMENTHPFVIGETALIHNGVIMNSDDIIRFHENISTCDSEAILQEYIANDVSKNPDSIQDVADLLDGWYACGVMTKDQNENPIVDIFKCRNSSLFVGLVPELDCFVFCTEIGILMETAKAAKMTVSAYDEIVGGKLIRLNAITGDRLELVEFKPETDKDVLKTISGKQDLWDDHPWEKKEWEAA
jgi:glutamine phosphoribosylpyrophosphate amidotransferase